MTDRPIIKRGDTFPHPSDGGTVKVMTVSDGYAMVRRPGCMPYVMSIKKVAALMEKENSDD